MNHSPEPWKADFVKHGNRVVDANGKIVFSNTTAQYAIAQECADQDRIVACVNFCKGIETELLERRDLSVKPNVTWLGTNAVRVTVLMDKAANSGGEAVETNDQKENVA